MGVEMRSVGGEHDVAEPRLHPHRLQAFGMAADVVHGDARHDLVFAVVERATARKDLAHHGNDVLDLERQPQRPMAHAASGGVGHFAVLQVIARLRKQIVVAAMVVMQVADDDVLDAVGRDAKRSEPLAHRLDHLALALLAHRLVEAGIDHDGAGRPDDRPDEEVERLQHVVGIAVDIIRRRRARVVAVTDGIDFVRVVAHENLPQWFCRLHRTRLPRSSTFRRRDNGRSRLHRRRCPIRALAAPSCGRRAPRWRRRRAASLRARSRTARTWHREGARR